MGFEDRLKAAREAEADSKAIDASQSAVESAAVQAAQSAAARLLPDVLQAAGALGRLVPPQPPSHLDPERKSRMVDKAFRGGPLVMDASSRVDDSAKEQFVFIKQGRHWTCKFRGWSFNLGGGLGIHMLATTHYDSATVELQALGPLGSGAARVGSPAALAEQGRIVWEAGSGIETGWYAGCVTAEKLFSLFLDAAARFIARADEPTA